ncbi:DNA repair protein RecO [Gynuella sp.]|uniref:DNA repair protein RecO n=1 Tax=Gynuella sp. TaxID=2969146 RepID=UPI003D14C865
MSGRKQQPAYIIHRKPWMDESELIECLTPEYGKLPLIRKHASRPLPLFQELMIEFSGRSEQKRLLEWQVSGAVHQLYGTLGFYGLYINELIYHLLGRYDHNSVLYGLYSSTLHLLQHSTDTQPAIRYFEKTLLEQLGYGLDWLVDLQGQSIIKDNGYQYYAGNGFAVSASSTAAIRGAVLLAIAHNEWHAESALFWAKRILTTEINLLLGGKTLKSRELFESASQ